ncbi:hypothetical protein Anapl_00064 [Anas platyrhynchos]|uniref:Uncharacterized protein n=1 Tax=Anas platyrhynchos TaxID=8839 RepID=R0K2M7_ANAPL|nr:hypothetical protein Anapl_00064 [Anas platyrhynchos]
MDAAAAPVLLSAKCRKPFSLKGFQHPSSTGMHEPPDYRMFCRGALCAPSWGWPPQDFGSEHRSRECFTLLNVIVCKSEQSRINSQLCNCRRYNPEKCMCSARELQGLFLAASLLHHPSSPSFFVLPSNAETENQVLGSAPCGKPRQSSHSISVAQGGDRAASGRDSRYRHTHEAISKAGCVRARAPVLLSLKASLHMQKMLKICAEALTLGADDDNIVPRDPFGDPWPYLPSSSLCLPPLSWESTKPLSEGHGYGEGIVRAHLNSGHEAHTGECRTGVLIIAVLIKVRISLRTRSRFPLQSTVQAALNTDNTRLIHVGLAQGRGARKSGKRKGSGHAGWMEKAQRAVDGSSACGQVFQNLRVLGQSALRTLTGFLGAALLLVGRALQAPSHPCRVELELTCLFQAPHRGCSGRAGCVGICRTAVMPRRQLSVGPRSTRCEGSGLQQPRGTASAQNAHHVKPNPSQVYEGCATPPLAALGKKPPGFVRSSPSHLLTTVTAGIRLDDWQRVLQEAQVVGADLSMTILCCSAPPSRCMGTGTVRRKHKRGSQPSPPDTGCTGRSWEQWDGFLPERHRSQSRTSEHYRKKFAQQQVAEWRGLASAHPWDLAYGWGNAAGHIFGSASSLLGITSRSCNHQQQFTPFKGNPSNPMVLPCLWDLVELIPGLAFRTGTHPKRQQSPTHMRSLARGVQATRGYGGAQSWVGLIDLHVTLCYNGAPSPNGSSLVCWRRKEDEDGAESWLRDAPRVPRTFGRTRHIHRKCNTGAVAAVRCVSKFLCFMSVPGEEGLQVRGPVHGDGRTASIAPSSTRGSGAQSCHPAARSKLKMRWGNKGGQNWQINGDEK